MVTEYYFFIHWCYQCINHSLLQIQSLRPIVLDFPNGFSSKRTAKLVWWLRQITLSFKKVLGATKMVKLIFLHSHKQILMTSLKVSKTAYFRSIAGISSDSQGINLHLDGKVWRTHFKRKFYNLIFVSHIFYHFSGYQNLSQRGCRQKYKRNLSFCYFPISKENGNT